MADKRLMLAFDEAMKLRKRLDAGETLETIVYECGACGWSGRREAMQANPVGFAVCPECKGPFQFKPMEREDVDDGKV